MTSPSYEDLNKTASNSEKEEWIETISPSGVEKDHAADHQDPLLHSYLRSLVLFVLAGHCMLECLPTYARMHVYKAIAL